MIFKQPITTLPFTQWLVQDKENRLLFLFSLAIMIVSFGWLKFVYPYPNFMPPDSYSYLEAAYKNEFINKWPIGYSKFLRLVSVFSRSHLVLVVLQYLLLMTGVLYLLITMRYLLAPSKWLFRSLFTISIINPLLPHIANFISSDCLFASLSLIWFTQLLWIIYQPSLQQLLLHSVILLLAFMVRFNALWYPFISITIIILIDVIPKRMKWLSIIYIGALILIFVSCTQYEYYKKTGTAQYSAFGGWQMAANALYGYAYAKPNAPSEVPIKFQALHIIVNNHMDSLRKVANRPDQDIGVYYLWDFKSPLVMYARNSRQKAFNKSSFSQWASMGPLYGAYGRWLISQHPGLFIKYFVWPNLVRFYGPPAFFMGMYNQKKTKVDPIAVSWFNWKNNQLPSRQLDRTIHIMIFFTSLLPIINPLFILCILLFIYFSGLKQCNSTSKNIISCILLVWLGNCIFSVLSAPIELRYQIFPVVITLPFCLLFGSSIVKSLQCESKTSLA